MAPKFMQNIQMLDLEERIVNGAAAVAMFSVALPWIGGDWPGGDTVSYSGFGYSTSYIGWAIFGLNLFILLLTVIPLAGGPSFLKKRQRELARMWASLQSLILVLATLTVLMRTSALEFTRLDVRFGVYICLAASIVGFFESCQRYIGYRRIMGQEVFHHPEDHERPDVRQENFKPPPPPPPPPALSPEEYRHHPDVRHHS